MDNYNISASTSLYGLIGNPVGHSFSPIIYKYLFEHYDIDSTYLTFQVDDLNLKDAVRGLKAIGTKGFNVTSPYKYKILKYVDKNSNCVAKLGSANVIKNEQGVLYAYNTDIYGVIKSFKYNSIDINKKNVLIIGSGDTARVICYALESMGVKSITMFNRTGKKAEKIAKIFEKKRILFKYGELNINNVKSVIKDSDVIINATSIDICDIIEVSSCSNNSHKIFFDVKYNPKETKFLKYARESGFKTINGLNMLVFQALKSFEIWTGIRCSDDDYKNIVAKIDLLD